MKKIFKTENKVLKIIMNVARGILFFFLAMFILVVCLQRFSDNKLSFFNYRMFTVISGSMAPRYNVGDVLIAKKVEPEKIQVGDTISYQGEKGDFAGKVITHEVVRIAQKDGKYYFHTQGLTNIVEDPVVSEDQVYGVVMYRPFILSLIYKIGATPLGFFIFIIVPVLFIIISEILSVLLEKEEKRNKIKQ